MASGIVRQDAETFANQYPAYKNDSIGETRKAMKALAEDPLYAKRYEIFHSAMVYGDVVSFKEALKTLHESVGRLFAKNF